MASLALDILQRISEDTPLVMDWGAWGWIGGRDPISPVLVQRWLNAGLLEDYGVDTLVLSNKGKQLAGGKKQ